MKLLELIRRESTVSFGALIFVAGLAGISNALVLAIINSAAEQASTDKTSTRNLVLFMIVMGIYVMTQWRLLTTATREVERILDRLRVRLADKIRRCDLLPLEEMGRTVIYASINKETMTISQSAMIMMMSGQAAVLIFFTAFYVAVLSVVAFVLTVVLGLLLSVIYIRRSKKLSLAVHETLKRENALFDTLTHLLAGFKEVRLNQARSNDLFAHYEEISHSATENKIRTQAQISRMFIFSQAAFYVLLGVIVFVVPRLSTTYSTEVVKITTAVLFLVGPMTALVGTVPNLAGADVACENIATLEAALDHSLSEPPERFTPMTGFREITFRDVVFHYHDSANGNAFTVGPIDFDLAAGEIVFVSGGNGSGKSTFLKLLTALYYPQEGSIRIDGRLLTPVLYESYRSLFSTVFTDYHLFDRLYGLYDVPEEEVDRQLAFIEMTGKTKVVDSRFETLELSGGQKKRLALLVSLLEKRPICVFDEMAADQDPAFRKKFYKEILPLLHQQGRTIVVVTHDDKYFGDADRLLKMDEGRFVSHDPIQ
jgi:putative ATP-binding cassette transporter